MGGRKAGLASSGSSMRREECMLVDQTATHKNKTFKQQRMHRQQRRMQKWKEFNSYMEDNYHKSRHQRQKDVNTGKPYPNTDITLTSVLKTRLQPAARLLREAACLAQPKNVKQNPNINTLITSCIDASSHPTLNKLTRSGNRSGVTLLYFEYSVTLLLKNIMNIIHQ